MTEDEFRKSLVNQTPPTSISTALTALWWQKNGNWEKAHEAAQSGNSQYDAWVHGLLHREEGDLSNAHFWYRRANQKISSAPLSEEWDNIVAKICSLSPTN